MSYQNEKKIVLDFFNQMEIAQTESEINSVLDKCCAEDYFFRGVYPFRELNSKAELTSKFMAPLKKAIKSLQRRQDIFIAGDNEISEGVWIMSMGHLMGLFDEEWLNVRPNGKMVSIRYAEFTRVEDGKIMETGLFMDLVGFMQQVGYNPLPESTGQYFVYPGPRNHNGLLFDETDPLEGKKTLDLVNQMVMDLSELNDSGAMGCPPELLAKSWKKDMIWYGPAGIGASYTIERYQLQHQLPFRNNLKGKKFNGHVARFAEGNFSCFFGWPNLTNTPMGGFLGLPGGDVSADMQVVDVYYRDGDKLSENWVLIDLPYWLKQQGVDIFERTTSILNPSYLK